MSIENRLAAKERAKKARRNAVLKKVGPVLVIAVAALLIFGIYFLHKDLTESNYSKGLTKDGKIKGYNAKSCLSDFPDLNSIDIKAEEVSAEAVGEEIEKQMKALIEAKKSADADADGKDADDKASGIGAATVACPEREFEGVHGYDGGVDARENNAVVAAIAASFVERTTPKVAGGREKKAVAVRASEAATFHTVLCCPLAGGIVHHFLPLYKGGGTPSVVGGGGIVAGLQDGQVVGETVVAIR